MEKKIFLLIVFIFGMGYFSYSQTKYEIKATLVVRPPTDNYGDNCRNDMRVTMISDGNIRRDIFTLDLNNVESPYEKTITFTTAQLNFNEIEVSASRNWRRKVGCGGNGSFNGIITRRAVNNDCSGIYTNIARWWNTSLRIEVTPKLDISYTDGTNPGIGKPRIVCESDAIGIKTQSGFTPQQDIYRWEYMDNVNPDTRFTDAYRALLNTRDKAFNDMRTCLSNSPGNPICDIYIERYSDAQQSLADYEGPVRTAIETWREFTRGSNNISFVLSDLYSNPSDQQEVLGYDIPIRINTSCDNAIIDSEGNMQILKVLFLPEPPSISEEPTVVQPTCSYSDDAGFTLHFDRALYDFEELYVSIFKKNELGNYDASFDFNEITSLNTSNSYKWRPTNTSDNITGGDYKLEVRGYHIDHDLPFCDVYEYEFTIENPPQVVFSAVASRPETCFNENDGQITITASGGSEVYQYKINNENWSAITFTEGSYLIPRDFASGIYNIEVRDTNECLDKENNGDNDKVVSVDIEGITSDISHNYVVIPPGAPGLIDGAIRINSVSGGVPASNTSGVQYYGFTLENSLGIIVSSGNINATGDTFSGLKEDDYILTYTYKKVSEFTCSKPFNISVQDPEKITFSSSKVMASCYNEEDVLLRVYNISGGLTSGNLPAGSDDYTIRWEYEGNPNYSANDTVYGGIGNYKVIITDGRSGSAEALFVVDESDFPDPIAIEVSSIIPVKCYGGNAIVTLNATGGTTGVVYEYSSDSGITWQDENVLNLPYKSNSYRVFVRDKNNITCRTSDVLNIDIDNQPSEIIVSEVVSSHINNTIHGGEIGELVVEAFNDTVSTYTYSWTKDGLPYSGTGSKLTGLGAGSYQVIVTDANGCPVSLESPIVITEPDDLLITNVNATPVNCYGESTGGINITVSGGVGNYSYVWIKQGDASFTATSPSISELSSGFYEVAITDESIPSDLAIQTIEITQNTEITITLTNQENNICYNDNQGSLDIAVTGGVSPYTYGWDNEDETQDINGLRTGPYTVTVTDALGCTMQGIYEITQPADAVAISSIELTQITAFGTNNGAIDLTISGGASPYTFDWFSDTGFTATDEDIANLGPGNYTVVVSDANSSDSGSGACTAIREFEIIEPGVLLVSIEGESSLYCNGDTGELTANVSGGVSPFSYEWYQVSGSGTTLVGSNTAVLSNIGAGTYRVEITDANDIETQSTDFILSEPEELLLTEVSRTNVLCYGSNTGSIDMSITGGTSPYYISWDNGSSTEDIENLIAGNYRITVEDSNGCIKTTLIEIINVNDELVIDSFDFTDVTSFDGTDGSISIDFTGGASPFTIEWALESTNEVVGSTASINNLIAGDYSVNITDVNGCGLTEIYTIVEPDIVVATIENPTCAGFCDGSITLVVAQGNGDFTYTWSNGSASRILTNACAGTYTVAIGGYGSGDRILERTYEIIDPAPLVIDLGNDKVLCQGQTYILDGSIDDADATYQWTSDTGFAASTATVELSAAGTYSLTVTNSIGCEATDEVTITRTEGVISSEFAISSQVFTGEPVVVVNLSNPTPDSLEWELPEGGEVLESTTDFVEMVFNEPGEYTYGMLTRIGDCESYQEKRVVVIDRSDIAKTGEDIESERIPSVIEFKVYPNPSTGIFTLKLELKEEQKISLKVFRLIDNAMIDHRENENRSEYTESYDLSRLPPGMYFILLETPTATQIKKIIID